MFYCEHGKNLENERCRECDEIDRDSFARSLSFLSDEEFHKAMALYDADNERQ